jgi:hypothetical protein
VPASGVATCLALVLAQVASTPAVAREPPVEQTDRRLDPAVPRAIAGPAGVAVPEPAIGPRGEQPASATSGEDAMAVVEVEIDDAPGYDPMHDSPEGLKAQRRIRGGIALTTMGALLSIGSIVLAATDPCRPLAGNSCQVGARNRAAWVIGAPGVAMLAGGITLLTLGVLGRQRIRAAMTASRQGGGLVLSGRF